MSEAQKRIWADIDDEHRSGAMIGIVFANDLGDVEYIRADIHAAEIARLRAKVDAADSLVRLLWDDVAISDMSRDDYLAVMVAIDGYREAG